MRTLLGFVIVVSIALPARANVGAFFGSGHTLALVKTEAVQLRKEKVIITPGRGRRLFGGNHLAGLDVAEYECTFVLRNLKQAPVTIQVGFPLNATFLSYPEQVDKLEPGELVRYFRFMVQDGERGLDPRFQPRDGKGEYKYLFLWNMTFAPGEEREIVVSYVMPLLFGPGVLTREMNERYAAKWHRALQKGYSECIYYVTSTGRSWAGVIEEAEFRIDSKAFEQYLKQRPVVEFIPPEAPPDAKEQILAECPVWRPCLFRNCQPRGWRAGKDDMLVLKKTNYEPEEDLLISFCMPPFPQKIGDARRLLDWLWQYEFTDDDRGDLADILREFNGEKTGNKRIGSFLRNQYWYGQPPLQSVPAEVIAFVENGG